MTILHRRVIVGAALALFASASTPAQSEDKAEVICSISECSALSLGHPEAAPSGPPVLDWSPTQIWSYIENILQVAGLAPNFDLIESSEVGNAAAAVRNSKRVLLYNPTWVKGIGDSERWKMYGLLSHEIGHHLQGHTLMMGGSKPPIELEADKYAGFILGRMGATETEAISLWEDLSESGSDTHPPRVQRLAAVRAGWLAGGGGGGGSASVPPPEQTQDYIIADSDRRRLGSSDIANFPPAMLRVARNEILARHGYAFKSPDLIKYFGTKPWYSASGTNVRLSKIETDNVNFIKRQEDAAGGEAVASGFILPQSSSVRLSVSDVGGFSARDLGLARNEIFARHGYIFTDRGLDAYFRTKPWYRPRSRDVSLSGVEQANVALIRRHE